MRNHLLITTAILLLVTGVPALAQGRSGGDNSSGHMSSQGRANSNSGHSGDREFGRDRAKERADMKDLMKDRKDKKDGDHANNQRRWDSRDNRWHDDRDGRWDHGRDGRWDNNRDGRWDNNRDGRRDNDRDGRGPGDQGRWDNDRDGRRFGDAYRPGPGNDNERERAATAELNRRAQQGWPFGR